MAAIDDYDSAFRKLHRDMHHRWPAATLHGAPHKPLLLLAVMDAVAAHEIHGNAITLTPALQQRFHAYWRALRLGVGLDRADTPFRHMANEPFWHPVQLGPGATPTATMDSELVALLQTGAAGRLRAVLVDTYFHDDARDRLHEVIGHTEGVALEERCEIR